MNKNVVPLFYTRCVNAPYTEGHIQVVRMMVKSLQLYDVESVIFNFRYNVDQLNGEDEHLGKHRIEQKIPFVTRDSLYQFNPPIAAYALSMEALKTLRFFLLERALKDKGCVVNIVNCSRYPRMFLRRLSSAPVILHFYMPNIRLESITRALAEKADLVVASSHTLSQHLERIGVAGEKIRVVYPPVDTRLYKPLEKRWARSRLDLSIEAKTIVYIGGLKRARFSEETMLKVMKELVKEIPEVTLLVFTSTDSENRKRVPEILRKTKRANLTQNVIIRIEDLTDIEKTVVYSAADVFLFPRFAAKTAIIPPLVVLEAMASGAAVVAPKTPSLNEMITDNKNGFLYENDDLAVKLANALGNKDIRMAVSKRARQMVKQKMSLSTIGAEIVELYRNLLDDGEEQVTV